MRSWSLGVGVLVGGGLGVGVACGPEIIDNHRDLADEACRDITDKREECRDHDPWTGDHWQREFDACVADNGFDMPDECGDLHWAYIECLLDVPCERAEAVWSGEDTMCDPAWNDYWTSCL